MKAHVSSKSLAQAVAVAAKAVPGKPIRPGVSGVLLDANEGTLTVSGCDDERRAWHRISAQVDDWGGIILPVKPLVEFLGALNGDEMVQLTVNAANRCGLLVGKTRAQITGIDAELFPAGPDLDDPAFDLTTSGPALATLIGHVIHAASKDEVSRATLVGVNLHNANGPLEAWAADGYRAAMDALVVDTDGDLSISARAAGLIECVAALRTATSGRMLVDQRGSVLVIDTEVGSWATRLIEGPKLDIGMMLRPPVVCTVTAHRETLLRSLRLVKTAEDTEMGARFRLTVVDGGIHLRAGDLTQDRLAETDVDARVEGEIGEVMFNTSYVQQALAAINSANVTIELTGVRTPMVIREPGARGAHVQVVMPMHIER